MSTLNDTDLFIVSRDNINYRLSADQMSTLNDTDLFIVERNGTQYKVEAKDVNTGGGGGDLTQVNLAPLSGTPEFEVTATTNLSEILAGSTINYQWYRYTASTGGTGTLVQEITSDSAILDTYTTGAADQSNYIGCTVTYLGTTVTETARTQCLVAPGPVATMHGLRFDNARTTYLQTTTVGGGGSTWTFSTWIKPTAYTPAEYIISGGANGENAIRLTSDGTVQLISGVGNVVSGTTGIVPLNTWTNLVVSNSSEGTTVYFNGTPEFLGVLTFTYFNTGVVKISQSSSGYGIDGYLSETYFVEQALPPTTFGKNFEPYGWGPLDSSQIKEKISNVPVLSPYDTRANTSAVWSDDLTGTFSNGSAIDVFNGTDTRATVQGNSMIFTPSGGINVISSFGFTYSTSQTTQYKINGGNYVSLPSSPSETTKVIAFSGTLTSIEWNAPTQGELINVFSVEVDERLLIDTGVWNVSQNWSGDATITGSTSADAGNYGPWKYGFDGNPSTFVETSSGTKLVFATPVPFSSLQMKATGTYKINNTSVTASGSSSGNAVFETPAGITSPISSIELLSGTSILMGVKVDGAILVDAGVQWDTSRVWSDSFSTDGNIRPGFKVDDAFNGSTGIPGVEVENATYMLFDFTSNPIPVGSGLKIRASGGSSPKNIVLNDNPATSTSFTNQNYNTLDIPLAGETEVKTIRAEANCSILAIWVNYRILVDKSSFGANGFYLPFDPTNTGVNYSSSGTLTGGALANGTAADLFNGSITGTYVQGTGNNFDSTTFTFATPIPATSVTLYTTTSGLDNQIAGVNNTRINDASFNTQTSGNNSTVTSGITELSSVQFSGTTALYAIAVDGKMLINYNSIGVDDSGNENNFLDQNFGVGNTSQVWSSSITNMGGSGYPATDAFNYSKNSLAGLSNTSIASPQYAYLDTNTTSVLDNINVPITSTVSVLGLPNNPSLFTCTVEATDGASAQITGWSSSTIALLSTSALAGKTFKKVTFITGNTGFYLGGIVVDGNWLIDPNQQDTVTDTPLMNYAVLAEGTNGNLIASTSTTGNLSYSGETGVNYYYEDDGTGVTAIGPVPRLTNTGTKTFNFGQQPFVASNVIYDQATGTVELPADPSPYEQRANTDQVWSDGLSECRAGDEATKGFDGNASTNAVPASPGETIAFTGNISSVSSFKIKSRTTAGVSNETVTVTGTNLTTTVYSGDKLNQFVDIPVVSAGQAVTSFTLTSSNSAALSPGICQLEINGRLLVDQGVWDASQNWSGLTNFDGTKISITNIAKLFDGDTNTSCQAKQGQSNTITWASGVIGGNTGDSIRVYFQGSITSVQINGTTRIITQYAWNTIPENYLTSIEVLHPSGGSISNPGAIEVNGALLVDSGAQWNTSRVWSDGGGALDGGSWELALNGVIPSTISSAAGAYSGFPNTSTLTFDPAISGSIRVWASTAVGSGGTADIKLSDGSIVNLTGGQDGAAWYDFGSKSGITSLTLGDPNNTSGTVLGAIELNGALLVNPTGGTYNTLFQTWEESKAVTFTAQIAAANVLMAALTEHAQTYSASENYDEGSVIKAFGELWIAINDVPATTFATLPALASHPNWTRLGL